MIKWLKEWWGVVVLLLLAMLLFVLGFAADSSNKQADNQRLIECIERVDDAEWCVESFGH